VPVRASHLAVAEVGGWTGDATGLRMSDPTVSKNLEIKNRLGLHARAAAQLVQIASQFDADISVSKDGQVVNGKSILGLMMLAAAQGTFIEVAASGPQAVEALQAIEQLVEQKFNEE
jgi:phosphocarrier protein HPr